ncbi:MAG TPA: hypothetical protein HA362_04510 [Nanoarchaeota archaeon]|nr:hypothetical protein [Nanoarchaeota archaeon]
MKFKVEKKEKRTVPYPEAEFAMAQKFAGRVWKEFGDFIKAVVVFGSVTQQGKDRKDIDILVILDDVRIKFNEEIVQTYRIIVEKIVADIGRERLHIQSMKFTSFWEYVRVGDPVAVNILRYGIALVDTGFFDPLQALLDEGRIRPSKEAIYNYFVMAPGALSKSKNEILAATVDLYWAVIDAGHAALMKYGEVPPSPEHVGSLMEKTLVAKKHVSRKAAKTMDMFYKLFKGIADRNIKEVTGVEYSRYRKQAEEFVEEIKKYIEKA